MTQTIKTNQPIIHNRAKTTQVIANFWDNISECWRAIWGLHIHHGYYETNQPVTPLQAQEKLIEKLAEMTEIQSDVRILDVGCGMGGSSIYLAKKFNAKVTGITLSQTQLNIANQLISSENIKNVDFKIEDALTLESFANNSFDIIWSLESCEQFYDKDLFIQQAYRVLKPGGKIMLATWCSDREEYEGALAQSYKKLCFAFDLPYIPTIQTYRSSLEHGGFKVSKEFDWSNFVKQSWHIGISLVNTYSFIQILRMAGWRGFRFVKQIKMMRDAFHQQRVKYGVFLAFKG